MNMKMKLEIIKEILEELGFSNISFYGNYEYGMGESQIIDSYTITATVPKNYLNISGMFKICTVHSDGDITEQIKILNNDLNKYIKLNTFR